MLRVHDNLDSFGVIAHATHTAGTAVTSSWINVANYTDVAFFLVTGTLTDTLTVKVQYASDSSGTGVADATLNEAGATSITVPATFDSSTGRVSIRPRSIPSGFTYARLSVLPNTANAPFNAYLVARGEQVVPSMTATQLLSGN